MRSGDGLWMAAAVGVALLAAGSKILPDQPAYVAARCGYPVADRLRAQLALVSGCHPAFDARRGDAAAVRMP